MKIALDISSTTSGHQFRGIGFYTKKLHEGLAKIAADDKTFTLLPFTTEPPEKADLYHFPAFSPFFFSFPFHLVKKTVITVHDLIPLEYPSHYPAGIKGTIRWQLQKFFLKKARHIITDSDFSKQSIEKIIGICKENVSTVYLAVDKAYKQVDSKSQLEEIKEKYQLPDKFVLYVGDMNWNKNVMSLVEVCKSLHYPLVVVGKQAVAKDIDMMHPWNTELVKFQMAAEDNKDLIKRLGFVKTEDLAAIYNVAVVFVCPSIAEGFGLPVLEALSCGCPVISSNTTSLPEVYGTAALGYNPVFKDELKEKLQLVWEDEQLRKELKLKGLEQAQTFSWQKTIEETLSVYKKILTSV